MEKETIAIASALAGAAVTTAAALIVRRLDQAKHHQALAAEVHEADRTSYARGWLEGQTKLLREFTGEYEIFSDPMATA